MQFFEHRADLVQFLLRGGLGGINQEKRDIARKAVDEVDAIFIRQGDHGNLFGRKQAIAGKEPGDLAIMRDFGRAVRDSGANRTRRGPLYLER